jgi:signal transduction histidine kinase
MAGPMKDLPFVVRAERQIYAEYDRDRRLRISRVIAPSFATILTLLLIASQIAPQQFSGTRHNLAIIALCDALFIVGAVAAFRRRVNLATTSILLAGLVIMALSVLVNQPFILSDLYTVPAVVIIGLSALIGRPWMILATSALATVFVLFLSHIPSLEQGLRDPNNMNSLGAFVIELWLLALVLYGAARGYRTVLSQISDVRVQYERARQLDDLKDQFITSVNHELRNPVMLLNGYVELLRLKGGELSPERRDDLVKRASQAGESLSQLVQSILDTRRLGQEARNFTPEAAPVTEAVMTATTLVDPKVGKGIERELRLNIPPDLAIQGEKVRLQQIVSNLLTNAIKYSAPGTPIEISARVVAEKEPGSNSMRLPWPWPRGHTPGAERRMVEIVVRDYGLGIPPDQQPLLFQRFVRLPRDLASTTIGNGLGLHLCRELTESMRGRIWVESAGIEGEGSSMYVRLPLAVS